MTEQTTNPAETEAPESPLDELKLLKERARTMGIPISGNIGIDTLKKKIEAKLSGSQEQEPEEVVDEQEPAPKPMTKAQRDQELRDRLRKEKTKLVRCRIYNLNPNKRDLRGEIITVGNRYLGTVRKFIPFGEATDGGYHIPQVIFDDLKSRKFQQIQTKKNRKGQDELTTRMVPEYSIEILPPLTKEELAELATKQAAAERLGAGAD